MGNKIGGYFIVITAVALFGLIILKPAIFTDTITGFTGLVRNSFKLAST